MDSIDVFCLSYSTEITLILINRSLSFPNNSKILHLVYGHSQKATVQFDKMGKVQPPRADLFHFSNVKDSENQSGLKPGRIQKGIHVQYGWKHNLHHFQVEVLVIQIAQQTHNINDKRLINFLKKHLEE